MTWICRLWSFAGHCVFLSVTLRIQKKLSDGSPPPRANVSIWVSPGGTVQALMSSPEAHGVLFLTSFCPPRPDLLLQFDHPGLIRTTPDSARDIVLSLIARSCARVLGRIYATCVAYSSTHCSIPALKYGKQGQPASVQTFLRVSKDSGVYFLPLPLCSLNFLLPVRSRFAYFRSYPVISHTSSRIRMRLCRSA